MSIDFIVSMILVLILASTVISFGYFQSERVVETGYKLGAEALAISIGSAMNNFVAIDPDPGSYMNITTKDPTRDPGLIGLGGLPFATIIVDQKDCNLTINDTFVRVTVDYSFKGTGITGRAIAVYPLFSEFGGINLEKKCGDVLEVYYDKSGNWRVS